jgi:hypothetical protein
MSRMQIATSTEPQAANVVVYENEQYGFVFSLPASWTGYTILARQWTGTPVGSGSGTKEEHGPILIIRHPLWTKGEPREDIPIMVFTHTEWRDVQDCRFTVSAAPFPPFELGRNANWVFALPPRYNYDMLTGFEEVDQIMKNSPLRAF